MAYQDGFSGLCLTAHFVLQLAVESLAFTTRSPSTTKATARCSCKIGLAESKRTERRKRRNVGCGSGLLLFLTFCSWTAAWIDMDWCSIPSHSQCLPYSSACTCAVQACLDSLNFNGRSGDQCRDDRSHEELLPGYLPGTSSNQGYMIEKYNRVHRQSWALDFNRESERLKKARLALSEIKATRDAHRQEWLQHLQCSQMERYDGSLLETEEPIPLPVGKSQERTRGCQQCHWLPDKQRGKELRPIQWQRQKP